MIHFTLIVRKKIKMSLLYFGWAGEPPTPYLHPCMHPCMQHASLHASMHARMDACMHGCMHAWMHGCMHGCRYGVGGSPPPEVKQGQFYFLFMTIRVKGISKIIIYNYFPPSPGRKTSTPRPAPKDHLPLPKGSTKGSTKGP